EALETIQATVGAQTVEAIPTRIAALQDELRETRRRLKAGAAGSGGAATPEALAAGAVEIAVGVHVVSASGAWSDLDAMKSVAKAVRTLRPSSAIALFLDADEPQVFVSVSDDLVARGISAGEIVRRAVPALDGKGGGRPEMAQGRGSRREGLVDALAAVEATVREAAGAP
ncbi:MAG: DHHA1 domain-containing protein, partial [Chloroflexota bacterium]